MDLGGLPVTLLDTAGLRETDDAVESIGIGRAIDRAKRADIRVFLNDTDATTTFGLSPLPDDIQLWSKSDINTSRDGLRISAKSGQGIDEFIAVLSAVLEQKSANAMVASRERHRVALRAAIYYITEGNQLISIGYDNSEVAAEEIHQGINALNSLIGRVDVEHILDEIFSSFCVGK
jgi:tRNA modification GTPase